MQKKYTRLKRLIYICIFVLFPSVIFLISALNGLYVISFLAFLLSSFDFVQRIVYGILGKLQDREQVSYALLNKVGEIIFIVTFGFAGLSRWSIVAPILVVIFFVHYISDKVCDLRYFEVCDKSLAQFGRFVIVFMAFFLFFLFPGYSFGSFSISEVALFGLLFYSCSLLLIEINALFLHLSKSNS